MYLLLPLITLGGPQDPWLGSRDVGEGKPYLLSHLPGGLKDKVPELVTWQQPGWGLGALRPPGF